MSQTKINASIFVGTDLETIEADIAMVGDFRFPGGTSTAVASEIAALSHAGYRVALKAHATHFLSKRRSFNVNIQAELDAGRAMLVRPDQHLRAGLACLHHPALFETMPAEPLHVTAREAVLVVHHPPVDANGVPQYNIGRIEQVLRNTLATPVTWAPVGPKVRQAFRGLTDTPPMTSIDWVNVVDPSLYAGARHGLIAGRPVVGRHSRPSPLKWPDTSVEMTAAYPAADDIQVRLMGFEVGSVQGMETFPANWTVQPFNAQDVASFLRSIDFFSYFHSSDWTEAFGRSIIEAMASGAVCLLPKDFEPLFGEGAVYCRPQGVAETVRQLQADPDAFVRQSESGVALVRERFSPAIAVARVKDRIGSPASELPTPVLSQSTKPRVLYFTSNGIGMGHLTRVLACARRHREQAEPIVVSMSRAYAVARHEGILAEYLPYFRSSGMDKTKWQYALRTELTEMFRFYRPRVVVLDGNVPYQGLLDALAEFPEIWSVWLRRAMWPPGVGAHFLEHRGAFDAAIEPGEYASILDRGLTVELRQDSRCVAPISYLHDDEALDRHSARVVLGLDPDRPAVFLQLGSGNNMQTRALRSLIIDKLNSDIQGETPQIVVGQWQIGLDVPDVPENVTVLRSFPFARYLNAFDYAVALAGYNTFHENLRAGVPTLFVGNEHPEQDEQWLRADFARVRGCALAARASNAYEISENLFRLSSQTVQDALRTACARLPTANGADEAAAYLAELAHTTRPHPAHVKA